jgi:hypothetical protein
MTITYNNGQLVVSTNGLVDTYNLEEVINISSYSRLTFKPNLPPTSKYVVMLKFEDESSKSIELDNVTNQATWTDTLSGANTAISDITSWISAANSGQSVYMAEFMTVLGVDIDTWDASVGFTSDSIEFSNSEPWSIQILDYNITAVAPLLTLQVSTDGVAWSEYKPQSTDIDITDTANRVIFDDIMPFKYLRVVYVSGGSTGDFSIKIAK